MDAKAITELALVKGGISRLATDINNIVQATIAKADKRWEARLANLEHRVNLLETAAEQALSDLQWAEGQGGNFQASIIKLKIALGRE
jgi:hypothetical protein